jgi:uncharacterized membrane protein
MVGNRDTQMIIMALLVVIVLQSCLCFMAFTKSIHNHWWYLPCGVCLGIATNILWLTTTKALSSREQVYALSVLWDCAMVNIYFVIPVFFCGVKLDKIGMIGVALTMLGALLVKIRFN